MSNFEKPQEQASTGRLSTSVLAAKEFDALDQLERQESGRGFIGRIRLRVGYKTFVSGLSNSETFFAFMPGDEIAQIQQLQKAKELIAEHGAAVRPQAAVETTIFRDGVLNRDVVWKQDRVFTCPLWTTAYKGIVKDAIKRLGIKPEGEFWGRIAFREDPSGRMEKGPSGEDRVALIAYPAEVYESEAAAREAAGVSVDHKDGTGGRAILDATPGWDAALLASRGWTKKSWAEFVPTLKRDAKNGKTFDQIAADYDLPLKCVEDTVR